MEISAIFEAAAGAVEIFFGTACFMWKFSVEQQRFRAGHFLQQSKEIRGCYSSHREKVQQQIRIQFFVFFCEEVISLLFRSD